MIVFRFRDAKSVIRSQRDDDVVTEMGAGGIDGSLDIVGVLQPTQGRLRRERMERLFDVTGERANFRWIVKNRVFRFQLTMTSRRKVLLYSRELYSHCK